MGMFDEIVVTDQAGEDVYYTQVKCWDRILHRYVLGDSVPEVAGLSSYSILTPRGYYVNVVGGTLISAGTDAPSSSVIFDKWGNRLEDARCERGAGLPIRNMVWGMGSRGHRCVQHGTGAGVHSLQTQPKEIRMTSFKDTPLTPQRQDETYTGDTTNPKDRIGVTKPNLFLVPPAAQLYMALAMQNGADKYGPYNWREKKVKASIYIAACQRHLLSWLDGEANAEDSGVPHIAHALACLGIIADALETGNLVDDRPIAGCAATFIKLNTRS